MIRHAQSAGAANFSFMVNSIQILVLPSGSSGNRAERECFNVSGEVSNVSVVGASAKAIVFVHYCS